MMYSRRFSLCLSIHETGITAYDAEPAFKGDVLQFGDKFYKVGEGRKPFIADKTADNDFYIMTLAAIAMECKANNIHSGNIYIAVVSPVGKWQFAVFMLP